MLAARTALIIGVEMSLGDAAEQQIERMRRTGTRHAHEVSFTP